MTFTAYNLTRDRILVAKGWVATSFLARLRGLIGHEPLASGEGLLIKPCHGIHTFGMRFLIDAIFVDQDRRVVATIAGICPNLFGHFVLRAELVIELPAGTVRATGTQVGDQLVIRMWTMS